MGSVIIERRKAVWRDRVRAYYVLIDGERAGKIASSETARFELSPGAHLVQLKIDWCGSPALTVDGGQDTRLTCDAGGAAARSLVDILFRRNQYISLEHI